MPGALALAVTGWANARQGRNHTPAAARCRRRGATVAELDGGEAKNWLASDISKFNLLAIQIDGLHVAEDIVLIGAIGIDGNGDKHILGLVEGATESAAAVQALLDYLTKRGLDPKVPRLFILDEAKALSMAVRATVGNR